LQRSKNGKIKTRIGIYLDDYMICPWWRLEDKAGRQRKFHEEGIPK